MCNAIVRKFAARSQALKTKHHPFEWRNASRGSGSVLRGGSLGAALRRRELAGVAAGTDLPLHQIALAEVGPQVGVQQHLQRLARGVVEHAGAEADGLARCQQLAREMQQCGIFLAGDVALQEPLGVGVVWFRQECRLRPFAEELQTLCNRLTRVCGHGSLSLCAAR